MTSQGYATYRRVYDDKKRLLEERYFDADGNPVQCKAGYAAQLMTYAEGSKPISKAFFDVDGTLVERLVAARNYHAAYFQVRQLRFGLLDLAWHTLREEIPDQVGDDVTALESAALMDCAVLPDIPGSCISTAFGHIFSGGYSAGYYSYKWAEVLEADAFSLFREKGIFSREVAGSFRENILSRGGSEDEAVLYRRFRGHEPDPQALLDKLEIH